MLPPTLSAMVPLLSNAGPLALHEASLEDVPPAPSDQVVSSTDLRSILLGFLSRMDLTQHALTHSGPIDPIVAQKFTEAISSWDLGLSPKLQERHASVGLLTGAVAYRHTPVEVQVAVAIYTYLGTMCDDDVMSKDALRDFGPRLFDGVPQLHPILDCFVNQDRKSTRLNSSHSGESRMPSSA